MLSCLFMLREIELSHAMVGDWVFNHSEKELEWHLTASKSDYRALGTSRTWGRLCAVPGLDCPNTWRLGIVIGSNAMCLLSVGQLTSRYSRTLLGVLLRRRQW